MMREYDICKFLQNITYRVRYKQNKIYVIMYAFTNMSILSVNDWNGGLQF